MQTIEGKLRNFIFFDGLYLRNISYNKCIRLRDMNFGLIWDVGNGVMVIKIISSCENYIQEVHPFGALLFCYILSLEAASLRVCRMAFAIIG